MMGEKVEQSLGRLAEARPCRAGVRTLAAVVSNSMFYQAVVIPSPMEMD